MSSGRRHGWLIIGLLWIGALILAFIGFGRNAAATGQSLTPFDRAYLSLQLIPMNSGAVAGPVGWELQAGRFLIPMLAALTALRALLSVFHDRWQAPPPALLARPRDHRRAEPQRLAAGAGVRRTGQPGRRDRGGRGSRPHRPLSRARHRRDGRRCHQSRSAAVAGSWLPGNWSPSPTTTGSTPRSRCAARAAASGSSVRPCPLTAATCTVHGGPATLRVGADA